MAGLLWLSLAPGDPALYPGEAVTVTVIDHGYHAGLAVRIADLRAAALMAEPEAAHRLETLASLWPEARWLEIGWGDADFYRATRTPADLELGLTVRALFWPTPSTLQVVPLWQRPSEAFARSPRVALGLSEAGFRRLADRLGRDLTLRGGRPVYLGPSLYGPGAFLAAEPSYHAFRTCNQWVAGLLRAAGVPSSWFWSATSAGLIAELRLRAEWGNLTPHT
ncbi:MAG: DUF2459 domain-containing protein [Paracoccaceae bacterium]